MLLRWRCFPQLCAAILLLIVISAALLLLAGCEARGEGKVALGYHGSEAQHAVRLPTSSTLAANIVSTRQELSRVNAESQTWRVTGSFVADEKSQVAANAGGIVRQVTVDRGSIVRAGDVLARLDSRDAENALAEGIASAEEIRVKLGLEPGELEFNATDQPDVKRTRAALELADTEYKRNAQLLLRNTISREEVDKSRSEYVAARQNYDLAVIEAERLFQSYKGALVHLRSLTKAVEDTTVTAPFAGLISEKHVSPGERLMAGAGSAGGGAVATLVRISPIRLELTVSEQDISRISPGQEIAFQVPAFAGRTFIATVTQVSPELDAATRSLVVECTVPNENYELRPGMFATATISATRGRRKEDTSADDFATSSTTRAASSAITGPHASDSAQHDFAKATARSEIPKHNLE